MSSKSSHGQPFVSVDKFPTFPSFFVGECGGSKMEVWGRVVNLREKGGNGGVRHGYLAPLFSHYRGDSYIFHPDFLMLPYFPPIDPPFDPSPPWVSSCSPPPSSKWPKCLEGLVPIWR